MAKIPTYDSQRSINVVRLSKEAPATKVSPSAFGEAGRAMSQFGTKLFAIAQDMKEVQARNELYKANTESSRASNDILLRGADDRDDIGFMERRNKEIQDARNQISKTIKSRRAKEQFELEYERNAIDLNFKLKTMHNHLIIDNALDSFYALRDAETQKYVNAATAKEKELAINKVASEYNNLIKLGAMSQKTKLAEYKIWKDNLKNEQIENDIAKDPIGTKVRLEAGDYKDLSAAEKEEWTKVVDNKIHRDRTIADRELEASQEKTESDMGVKILDRQITEDKINQAELLGELRQDGGISKGFATVARRAAKSIAAINAKTKGEVFNRLQDEFVALDIKVKTKKGTKKYRTKSNIKDIAKFRKNVVAAYNDGNLESSVGRNWLVAASNVFDKAFDKEVNKRMGEIQNLWGQLSVWSDEFGGEDKEEVKARLGQELMDRLMNTDQDSNEIVDDLILKEQKDKNPNRALYEVDQVVLTPSGPVKVVDFDGDGEPIIEVMK